ncbi:preprotein translocase subunit SecG [Undibacterium sp. Jales W-56]|uniref:preprotein translocase subunit SecG n=1 Tax=Undibacterium sp. Jales W-56 TaxID=2897325 RepID=UPI0021D28AFB|nr:preprotein translocase subunit SecG [Undibacterium sp. Jales W-56]MCU6433062.1 preprotein translocase subunit SecG [Undibacterium sp. Jales W-56]
MHTLFTVVVVIQVLSALAIIGLVLLQHGKGADMGASFGSGASGSLFGATGSSNFLSKSTGLAAAVFFGATLALAFIGGNRTSTGGVLDNLPAAAKVVPASASAAAVSASSAAAPASAAGQANQIPK